MQWLVAGIFSRCCQNGSNIFQPIDFGVCNCAFANHFDSDQLFVITRFITTVVLSEPCLVLSHYVSEKIFGSSVYLILKIIEPTYSTTFMKHAMKKWLDTAVNGVSPLKIISHLSVTFFVAFFCCGLATAIWNRLVQVWCTWKRRLC